MPHEDSPLPRAGRMAFIAMMAVGTLILVALAGLVRESGNSVALDLWVLVFGYLCALLFGWRMGPRTARALAGGDSLLLGPLFGVATFLIGGLTGCLLHAGLTDPVESTETFWDLFISPFSAWLLIGSLPAMLVGGVFTAALTVALPRNPLPPKRPPSM